MTDLSSYLHVPTMVHSIDEKGDIVFVNQEWLRVVGYDREEVMGKPSVSFLSDKSRQHALEISLPLFRLTGKIRHSPYEMVHKNGSIIQVLLSADSILDADGNYVQSLAFTTDVSNCLRERTEMKTNNPESWILDPNKFNVKMLEFRKAIGATQEDIAKVLEMSSRTYQRIEHGEAQLNFEKIVALSKHYGVPPGFFFTDQQAYEQKSRMRVLIVEDDLTQAEIVSDEVSAWGYHVAIAHNGLKALEAMHEQEFDVVITDIEMPVMDGHTFLEKLQHLHLLKTPKVYVISGRPGEFNTADTNVGAENILTKPINFDLLKRSLARDMFMEI